MSSLLSEAALVTTAVSWRSRWCPDALSTPPATRPGWRIRAGLYAAAGGTAALSVAILVADWI
jgi:hypothetical protein